MGDNILKLKGLREALTLLQGLNKIEQDKILQNLESKDPRLTEILKKHLYSIEDLQFLNRNGFTRLLKEIDLKTMALALRGVSQEIVGKILNNMSKYNRQEIEDFFSLGKRPKSEVEKSQEEVLKILRKLLSAGIISLDKNNDSDPLV